MGVNAMAWIALRRYVRPRVRLTAAVGSLLLATSMMVVFTGAAPAAAAPPTAPTCSDTAPTEAAARAMAASCAKQVEVMADRTEMQQVYADPSGTMTMSSAV